MKKILIILFLFLGIGSGLVLTGYVAPEKIEVEKTNEGTTSSTDQIRDVVAEEIPGKPVYLSVPKLGLEGVVVEHVGTDETGQMEVPANDDNVAWFQPGYRPGARGNSVLAGHYDKSSGGPAVFYNLYMLETGDELILEDETGNTRTYRVTDKSAYPYDDFPMGLVFGKSGRRMLNLITCDGTWDQITQNYSSRLVVFSELVE